MPNSSLWTVSPMTHTALPARSSASVKTRPEARRQLPVVKYARVLPVMLVDQF